MQNGSFGKLEGGNESLVDVRPQIIIKGFVLFIRHAYMSYPNLIPHVLDPYVSGESHKGSFVEKEY